MALLNIDGSDMPTPSAFGFGVMDLSKAERNANGNMIIERIATKRKLELTWKYLTAADLATLINAVSPVFFTVIYMDAVDNANRTGTFYCGDRKAVMMQFQNGVASYQDVTFPLVER